VTPDEIGILPERIQNGSQCPIETGVRLTQKVLGQIKLDAKR
jgi:hypothetical protein